MTDAGKRLIAEAEEAKVEFERAGGKSLAQVKAEMMTDAPERIWADPDHWLGHAPEDFRPRPEEYVEYIRADLVPRWSDYMDAAPKDGTILFFEMMREVDASPTKSMIWEVNGRLYRVEAMPAPPKEGE